MIKSVSQIFKEQFQREMFYRHSLLNKKPSLEVEDAVVLHLYFQHWKEYATYKKRPENSRSNGKVLRKR